MEADVLNAEAEGVGALRLKPDAEACVSGLDMCHSMAATVIYLFMPQRISIIPL